MNWAILKHLTTPKATTYWFNVNLVGWIWKIHMRDKWVCGTKTNDSTPIPNFISLPYTGWPRNNGTVDTVDFSGLCSGQQLFSSPCWIEHLFPIIITPRSSNLVENFLFYETFLMDCHFREKMLDPPEFRGTMTNEWQIPKMTVDKKLLIK